MVTIGPRRKDLRTLIMLSRMAERVRDKVLELGLIWEEVEPVILEFLDDKYKSPTDGIEMDGENPKLTKKMRFFQTTDVGVFLGIRHSKDRMSDRDKIKIKVKIADQEPNKLRIRLKFDKKPTRIVKICEVGHFILILNFEY